MLIQKNYQNIIYYGLLFLTALLMLLGWSTKYLWSLALWGGVILCLFLIDRLFSNQTTAFSKTPIFIPLTFFIVIVCLSTFTSVYFYNSLVGGLKIILAIITFWLIIRYIDSFKKIRLFLIFFFSAGGIILIYGLINFFLLQNAYSIGIASTFGWRNVYAGWLLLLLPMAITFYLVSAKKIKNLLALLNILLLVNLYLTFSQASWLALIIALIFIIYFLLNNISIKQIAKRALVVVFGSIFLIWVLVSLHPATTAGLTTSKIKTASGLESASVLNRLDYWETGWEIFKTSPVLGIGLGNFGTLYTHHQKNLWSFSNSPHNFFILLAVETGILGLISFWWFLYRLFKPLISNLWRQRKKILNQSDNRQSTLKLNKKIVMLGLTGSLMASFVHAMLDVDWEIPSLLLQWLILAGTAYLLINIGNEKLWPIKKPSWPKQQIFWTALIIIIGCFIIALSLSDSYNALAEKNLKTPGEGELAIKNFKKSLYLIPFNASSHSGLSRAYWNLILERQGLRARNQYYILKHAKKAVSLNPKSANTHYLLGWAYLYSSNKDSSFKKEMTASWEKTLKLDPFNHPEYYLALAKIYRQENMPDSAKKILATAINNFDQQSIQKIFTGEEENKKLNQTIKEIRDLYNIITETRINK